MSNRINDTRIASLLTETKNKNFGANGHIYITNTTVLPIKTKFYAIQVLEESEISYTDGDKQHLNITLPQSDTIFGNFTSISVVTGRVRAYIQ